MAAGASPAISCSYCDGSMGPVPPKNRSTAGPAEQSSNGGNDLRNDDVGNSASDGDGGNGDVVDLNMLLALGDAEDDQHDDDDDDDDGDVDAAADHVDDHEGDDQDLNEADYLDGGAGGAGDGAGDGAGAGAGAGAHQGPPPNELDVNAVAAGIAADIAAQTDVVHAATEIRAPVRYGEVVHGCTPLGIAAKHGHVRTVEGEHPEARVNIQTAKMPSRENSGVLWCCISDVLIPPPCRYAHVRSNGASITLQRESLVVLSITVPIPVLTYADYNADGLLYILRVRACVRVYARACIKVLIHSGQVDVATPNEKGCTPLMLAAEMGRTEIVEMLLNQRADLSCQDEDGDSALLLAVNSGHLDTVTLLLERADGRGSATTTVTRGSVGARQAVVEAVDSDGTTAIMVAAYEGHLEIAALLLQYKCDVNATDSDHQSPLMFAVETDQIPTEQVRVAMAKLLLENGAKIDHSDKHHTAIMIMACRMPYPNPTLVQLLLDHGANVSVRDMEGWSPLATAADSNHFEIGEILLKHGAGTLIKIRACLHMLVQMIASFFPHLFLVFLLVWLGVGGEGAQTSAKMVPNCCACFPLLNPGGHLS